tara:strand:+ start:1079 stop:2413 length:1335 start_codon:yes stop_codon:yes gene_type:complete
MAFGLTGDGGILNPSNTQQATLSNYVSTLNLHKRDVDEQVYARYGAQGITGLLEMMGAKKECTNGTFEHFEESLLHDYITVTAVNIGAKSGDLVLGTTTVAAQPVRPGNVLRNASGLTLHVSAVAQDGGDVDVTVYNYANANIGNLAGADLKFAIIGTEYTEGSGQPLTLTPKVTQYTNTTMIIKESFQVSGSEASNVSYVKVDGGYLWYLKGEADTYKRFLDYAEMQLVLGKKYSNASAAPGGAITGTEGLMDFIDNGGIKGTLDAAITMDDLDATIKQLDKFRGSKENALMCGINLSLDIDDIIGAKMGSASGASFGTFGNDKDMAVNMGFNSFSRGGYSFHKKTYDLFNHPSLGEGLSLAGDGIIIPMDSQRDAKGGDMIPSLRMRYKAVPGYSREMEHWLTGSAVLANKTNGDDVLNCNYRTERGFEGFGANRFVHLVGA